MFYTKYKFRPQKGEELSSLIQELTDLKGVSSAEHEAAAHIKRMLDKICDSAEIDKSGNVIARISAPDRCAKTLMLEAHLDRIGLMVTKICDEGIKFTSIGGVDERILPAEEVMILGKEPVFGVITAEEIGYKNPKAEQMLIDTGLSLDKIKEQIKVGDMVLLNSSFTRLCGNKLSCAAMDNRAGIASIIGAIGRIDRAKLKHNIVILFSVQEELGLHGAYTGAEIIKPDAAIVVDVTHGSTRDTKDETGVFSLGCGAVICRGPNFDYDKTKQLIKIATDSDIPYAIEVASGPSGTSAWATQISGGGIPSMLISIPLRYMHTNLETLDIADVDAVCELLVRAMEGGVSLD